MANITKRMNKKMAAHLGGEPLQIALLLEPRGQYGIGMVGSVLATRTARRAMESRDARDREAAEGLAEQVPAGSQVLAITPTRAIFARSNGLKVHDPELVIDRGQVRVGSIEGKGLGKRVVLAFADGSGVEFDAQRGQPFDDLIQALGTADPG